MTVRLVETVEGVEVGVRIGGAVVMSISVALFPETAAGLGEVLLDHAQRAGTPGQGGMVAVLDAVEGVSVTDEERQSLRWLCRYGGGGGAARGRADHPGPARLGG